MRTVGTEWNVSRDFLFRWVKVRDVSERRGAVRRNEKAVWRNTLGVMAIDTFYRWDIELPDAGAGSGLSRKSKMRRSGHDRIRTCNFNLVRVAL
jgi:hypothetical protein